MGAATSSCTLKLDKSEIVGVQAREGHILKRDRVVSVVRDHDAGVRDGPDRQRDDPPIGARAGRADPVEPLDMPVMIESRSHSAPGLPKGALILLSAGSRQSPFA